MSGGMRVLVVATALWTVGCVGAPPEWEPVVAIGIAELDYLEVHSELTRWDLYGPDLWVELTWTPRSSLPPDVRVRLGEVALERTGEAGRTQTYAASAPLPAGTRELVVEHQGSVLYRSSFEIHEPCNLVYDGLQTRVHLEHAVPLTAEVTYPLHGYGAAIADVALQVTGDGVPVPGDVQLDAGSATYTADEPPSIGSVYSVGLTYTCDGEPYGASWRRRLDTSCRDLAAAATVSIDASSGVLVARGSWPEELESVYGAPESAALVLREYDVWCDSCGRTEVARAEWDGGAREVVLADDGVLANARYDADLVIHCASDWGSATSERIRVLSELGLPDPAVLAGRVYGATGREFTVPWPLSAHDVQMPWLPLLEIVSVDADGGVEARLGWTGQHGVEPAQKACTETVPLPPGRIEGERIAFGPADLVGPIVEIEARVYDFELTVTPSADGTRLADIAFSGLLDMRGPAKGLGYARGEDFCSDWTRIPGVCTTCPDGVFACIDLDVQTPNGLEVQGNALRDQECPAIRSERVYGYGSRVIGTTDVGSTSIQGVSFDGDVVWERTHGCSITSVRHLSPERMGVRGDCDRNDYFVTMAEYDLATGAQVGSVILLGAPEEKGYVGGCSTAPSAPGGLLLCLGLLGLRRRR